MPQSPGCAPQGTKSQANPSIKHKDQPIRSVPEHPTHTHTHYETGNVRTHIHTEISMWFWLQKRKKRLFTWYEYLHGEEEKQQDFAKQHKNA